MNKSLCITWTFTIYLTITCNHKSIIHKSIEKEAYMWVGGFCLRGRTKKKNARVLRELTSFLSNKTGPSNNTHQWGLKPLEEGIVKDETISYNEG
jgi:metal-dependent hydrolase (beta-lactamase superfamily II)